MLFTEWLAHRNIETLLQLLEGADYFNPQQYNSAFVAGLNDLLGRIDDPAAREQIEAMRNFDFGSYIARSLARAGFTGDSLKSISTPWWFACCSSPASCFVAGTPKFTARWIVG